MINETLGRYFGGLNGERSDRNQKHPLESILAIGFLGALIGITSFSGLGDYAQAYEEELKEVLDLPYGAPSHDTIQRIWSSLEPEAFAQGFRLFTEASKKAVSQLIAIDGKWVRNSGPQPLQCVSAWCEANQLALAQVKVTPGSNEIEAIPRLLALLQLNEQTTITLDAAGCQRDIAQAITQRGAHYILALKKNQKTLYNDVQAYFESFRLAQGTEWSSVDKSQGRVITRLCRATDQIAWLDPDHRWAGLTSIAQVITRLHQRGKLTEETRYYLTSHPPQAEAIAQAVRAHWGIENKLHWRLDVLYREDQAGIRQAQAAETMSLLRKWALNCLSPHRGKGSLVSVQRKLMPWSRMRAFIKNNFHA